MRPLLLLILFLVSAGAAAAGEVPDEPALLQAENRRLQAEYEAARGQKIYFQFDLPADRIRIKASGIAIAELAVAGQHSWGVLAPGQLRTLVAKDALFAPERVRIEVPEEGKEAEKKAALDLQALELDDMPTAFHARLDDGTRLSLRPAPATFLSRTWEKIRLLFWFLTRPLISDWNFFRGKSYTEVRLLLPARDVQLLYWALADGSACLLDPPGAGAGD